MCLNYIWNVRKRTWRMISKLLDTARAGLKQRSHTYLVAFFLLRRGSFVGSLGRVYKYRLWLMFHFSPTIVKTAIHLWEMDPLSDKDLASQALTSDNTNSDHNTEP